METSIQVDRHPAPDPRAADGLAASHRGNPPAAAGRDRAATPDEVRTPAADLVGRLSVDPMRATDRYRLVLPGDPRF